jgi:hypothetical protein
MELCKNLVVPAKSCSELHFASLPLVLQDVHCSCVFERLVKTVKRRCRAAANPTFWVYLSYNFSLLIVFIVLPIEQTLKPLHLVELRL